MKIDEQLAIIKAYKAGKRIERRMRLDPTDPTENDWMEVPSVDGYKFNFYAYDYRVVAEIRPYKNAKELKQAMSKHGHYFINKKHRDCFKMLPVGISDDGVLLVWNNKHGVRLTKYTYKDLHNFWLHEDGTACGKAEGGNQ